MLRAKLYDFYAFLFSRSYFYKFNRGLHHASLRGLGVLNYKNDVMSGERRFIEKSLSSSDAPTVVDVGANEGDYHRRYSETNNEAATYSHSNPIPETYSRLSSRIPSAKNFFAANSACGSVSGSVILYDHAGGTGTEHASLHRGVFERIYESPATQYVVNVTTLDTIRPRPGHQPHSSLKDRH